LCQNGKKNVAGDANCPDLFSCYAVAQYKNSINVVDFTGLFGTFNLQKKTTKESVKQAGGRKS
jgi:hypothetical protein